MVLKVAWCCAIAKTNKAPFRNVCFYGPPGTGKVRHASDACCVAHAMRASSRK